MEVRRELPADVAAVRQVHLRTFAAQGPKVAALNDDLRESGADGTAISLVAVQNDVVVGHVMFSKCLLDAKPRLVDVYALSPVGVLPDYQRQGFGTKLIRQGLNILSTRLVPMVFLEGDPAFYSRIGFEPAANHGFRKPSLRIPDAAFQVMRLASCKPWMTGTFVYRDASGHCERLERRWQGTSL
jgi:putative acetyltransferase